MPFDGGLSPLTDRSKCIPMFGGTPLIQDLIEGNREGYNDLKGRGAWSSEPDEDKSYREKGDEYRLDENLRRLDKARATGKKSRPWVAEMVDGSEYEFPSKEVAVTQLRLINKPYRRLFRKAADKAVAIITSKVAVRKDRMDRNKTDIARMVVDGTVEVLSKSHDGKSGIGAAFCVGESVFVTCAHVIKPYEISNTIASQEFTSPDNSVTVTRDGRSARATVVYADPLKDIAILRADFPSAVLALSESKRHLVGEDVIVVGSPKGYENNVSEGVISSLDRVVFTHDGAPLHVFTDAKILPGNSGGPMVAESDGSVIGLIEIVIGDAIPYGLNAAVASEYVIGALKESGVALKK
jgi:S1-C subfamily serine protease